MNPSRDDLIREYFDKIATANTAQQCAALISLLDSVEHLGFTRGYKAANNMHNFVLDALMTTVPTVHQRGNNGTT